MLIIYPTVCKLGGTSGVVEQVPTLVVGVTERCLDVHGEGT